MWRLNGQLEGGVLGEKMKAGGSIWREAQQTRGAMGALGLKCEAPKTEGREGCCWGERGAGPVKW